MTTTHLGLDEMEGGGGIYEARGGAENEEGIEVRMRRSSTKGAGKAEAESRNTITAPHSVTFNIDCSVDSCVGCVEHPALYAKCFAVQECGVRRCMGTMVNICKPLCSIGQLTAQ